MLSKLLKRLIGGHKRAHRPAQPRDRLSAQLYLRRLEDRRLLNATVTLSGGNLQIQSDPAGGRLSLQVEGSAYAIRATSGELAVGGGDSGKIHQLSPTEITVEESLGQISFDGSTGDDTLDVNLSKLDVVPLGGLSFHGGGGANALAIVGTGVESGSYQPAGAAGDDGNAGAVTVGDRTITFDGLSPLDVSHLASFSVQVPGADRTLNVANGFNLTGSPGTQPAIVVSGTADSKPIETAAFWSINTLEIDQAAQDGNDSIVVQGAAGRAADVADLTIRSGSVGTDSVSVHGSVELAGTFDVSTAGPLSLDANIAANSVVLQSDADSVTLPTLTLSGSLQVTAAKNVVFDGPLDATTKGVESVRVSAGTGNVTFRGAVGGTTPPGTITISNTAGKVEFLDNVDVETLLASPGPYSVAFHGAKNTFSKPVTFENTGDVTLGDGGDEFLFVGGVTSKAKTTTLSGRLHTALSEELRTARNAVTLEAVTLAGDSVIDTTNNGTAAGGAITTGIMTGQESNTGQVSSLALNAGNGSAGDVTLGDVSDVGTLTVTQADNVTFSGAVQATTITLTDANDKITFAGDIKVGTLNTAAQPYNVIFKGEDNRFTNSVTFENTGDVTLGDGGDEFLFVGGVTSKAKTTTLSGNVRASGGEIELGLVRTSDGKVELRSVTLAGDSVIDTTNNGTAAGGAITTGIMTGQESNTGQVSSLALNAGNGSAGDVTLGDVSDVGTLTITQANKVTFSGAVQATTITLTDTNDKITFAGDIKVGTLNTAAQPYNVIFKGEDNRFTNSVTFENTGDVTLGDGGDEFLFVGGVTSKAKTTTLSGNVRASGGEIELGLVRTSDGKVELRSVTLAGDSVIDTTNNGTAAGGAITTGIMTGQESNTGQVSSLALNAGNGSAGDVTLGDVSDVGTLTITQANKVTFSGAVQATTITLTDANDKITFAGDIKVGTLNTAAQPYNVIFKGEDNRFTNSVTFENTGDVTLGDGGDEFLFVGGVTSKAKTTTLSGNVRASGGEIELGLVRTSDGKVELRSVTLAGDSVIDTTNNGTAAGGAITTGIMTGQESNTGQVSSLALNAGNGSAGDVTLGDVSDVGTLTITQANKVTFSGAVQATTITLTDANDKITFAGDIKVGTLNTAAQPYNVIFKGEDNRFTNSVTFENTGDVTLGDGGDEFLFVGGVTSKAKTTTLSGNVRASGGEIELGLVRTSDGKVELRSVTLAGDSVIDTTNNGTCRRRRDHNGDHDRAREQYGPSVQPGTERGQRQRGRCHPRRRVGRGNLDDHPSQ